MNPRRVTSPLPDPRESILGWAIRRAEGEGLKSVRPLVEETTVGLVYARDVELVRLAEYADALAVRLDVPAEALRGIGYAPGADGGWRAELIGFGGQVLPRKAVDLAHIRACPACLEERWVLKAVWEVACISVCPKHELRLLDQCYDCGLPLRATRPAPDACRCGRSMRRAPQVAAHPLAVGIARRLHASLGRDDDGAPAGDASEAFTFAELTRLIWALNLMRMPKGCGKAPELFHRRPVAEMEEILVVAGEMLQDWPDSAHRLFDQAEPVKWDGQMVPPSIEAGRPYQIINALPVGAAKDFLHSAWKNWPQGTGRKLPAGPVLLERRRREGFTLLTRGETRQVLGISDKGIDALERQGLLVKQKVTERANAVWLLEAVGALAADPTPLRRRKPSVDRTLVQELADLVGIDLRGAQRMIQKCPVPPFDLETMMGADARVGIDLLRDRLTTMLATLPCLDGDAVVSHFEI